MNPMLGVFDVSPTNDRASPNVKTTDRIRVQQPIMFLDWFRIVPADTSIVLGEAWGVLYLGTRGRFGRGHPLLLTLLRV